MEFFCIKNIRLKWIKKATMLSLILLLISVDRSVYAQSKKEILWIDKFDKQNHTSLLEGKWHKEGPETNLEYCYDTLRNSKILKFSYFFQSQTTSALFAAMVCSVPLEKIWANQIIGIAYEFKGSQHNLAYRTSSVLDYAFFQKKIPESKIWTTVFIPIKDLKQPVWGTKILVNPLHLQSLAWQIWGKPKDLGAIMIDNVRFITNQIEINETLSLNYFSPSKISDSVFSSTNYNLMNEAYEYKTMYVKYYQSINFLKECEKTGDSILSLIKLSSLTYSQKEQAKKLIYLAFNDVEGDVRIQEIKIRESIIKKINKTLPRSLVDTLDKKYKTHLISVSFINAWASNIWNYATSNTINYTSKSVSDSIFKNETQIYKFNKNDTVAEIGAGDGYFEQAISKYCNDLMFYVNEIDSSNIEKLTVKLSLLDLYDNKDIKYITVLGNEKTTNLPSSKFNKLIVKNSFHHFTYPNEMLKDFKRILKKNGKLFLSEIMMDEVTNPECKLFLTRKIFMDYLTKNGFTLINETDLKYNKFRNFEFQLTD